MPAPTPLPAFLYLLMRDHLPSGRVKEMIEHAQAADSLTAPELQALAERYAADLERSDEDFAEELRQDAIAPPPEPRPSPSGEAPALTKIKNALGDRRVWDMFRDTAGWLSVAQLVQVTGLKPQTVRRWLQHLVNEGEVEARGRTKSRRYRLDREHVSDHISEQTSDGEHDDGEEGVRPDDPPGDSGVQEGGPDSPGARPSTPVGTAARPEESDVELMARVGDYIKAADAEVYPTEIDSVFALDRGGRQRIIEMLLERHRIVKVGGGPRTAYISREKEANDFSFDSDDGLGTGKLHLRAPEKGKHSRAPKITDELVGRFKTWAIGQRTFKRRHVVDAFPDLSTSTIARLCARMAADGFLENRGSGGGGHYAVKPEHLGAAPADSLDRHMDTADGGTLEGRVMAALSGDGGSLAFVTSRVGAPEDEVKRVIAKLIREDNVRVGSSNGSVHYVTT